RLPVAGGTLSIVAPAAGPWLHSGGFSARAARGEEPPYWADVWPASVALARWSCRRRDLCGKKVLDLGCGLGVAGAAAAFVGAQVTFADREAQALAFATFNGRHNGRDPTQVVAVPHDWFLATLPGPFDLLLLADVTYRPVHHAPVLRQVLAGLGHEGIALHCDPFRREADGFLALARSRLAMRTFNVDCCFADQRVPVRIAALATSEAALSAWLGARAGAQAS
ncbi:MAG TPA: methyltransferase, partial [Planctomycetota bacterium]|nr:methyltransferase [Planctomycetota bacterium]